MAGQRQFSESMLDWSPAETGVATAPRIPRRPLPSILGRQLGSYDSLARAIEGEIIPRLMLTHRVSEERIPDGDAADAPYILSKDAVADLAALALTRPVDVGVAYLEKLGLNGLHPDRLFLDIISGAARRLGEMWTDDEVDFTDVTIGLTRLQQMLFELSPAFHDDGGKRSAARRILVVPAPGEQHTLGVSMVQEFFRRAGWGVSDLESLTIDSIVAEVKTHRYDVVGFSASCERHIESLTAAIRAVRRDSKNRSIGIMVGGRLFHDRPDLVQKVGADMTARDGQDAVDQVPALLGLSVRA